MFIRPVKPSDVEPLMDMLLDRDQFDQDGLHHVQKTLTHYFSGQSADLWFSAEHLGLAGIAYFINALDQSFPSAPGSETSAD